MHKLTIPQSNIWNLQKFYENTSIQNICGAVIYNEPLDRKLLEQAVNEEIRLQSGLRLRFCEENGVPVQYIADYAYSEIEFAEFDSEDAFNAYAEQFALKPFPLENSQMYHIVIFEINGKSGVISCVSHLISDAWTFSILARDVYNIYKIMKSGGIVDLPEYSYIDYAESEKKYLSSDRYNKDKLFWEEQYPEKPEQSPIKMIQVPVSVPAATRYSKILSKKQTSDINDFCKEKEISQAVLFEAAITAYLKKVNSENKSITIGVPVLNRGSFAEKNTVGMFISTMPLTIAVSGEDTVALLCERLSDVHTKIFRHQKYPYSHILQSLREKTDFSGNLYDVMVSYQNAQTDTDAQTRWFSNGYSEIPLALHIDNRDNSDCYTLTLDYQTEVFRQGDEVTLLTERILYIIEQIISDREITVGELSVLPEAEYQKVIYDFNDTAVDYPKEKCVHQLFEEQAVRTPDKVALVFEDKQFTYKQIDEMSNSLAHYLREKGVKPNDVVPIISKRDWRIIVAMFGILKAGGAYMPVDPSYPADRVEYMLETANSKIALTYGYSEKLSVETVNLADLDFSQKTNRIENVNSSSDLCYIIFTSGSTGKPKGVALRHSNVANYCDNNNNNVCHKIIKNGYESIVSVTNIVFDIFVTESLLPLVNGLTVYFANDEQVFSQHKLSELFMRSKIDVMQTTPTKMRSYILDKNNVGYLSKLKAIILGGEALPADLYEELSKYTSAEIFNIYGPAETTVWSTNKHVTSTDITIGNPIANTQIYILDSNKKPLPIGVAGELCISGDGVGAGYLNRPELTAEKFIPNPFISGKTMYCTGDLARWREDGEIEYLGRIDTQVKIRGLRIELGEIESVMSAFEGVQLCAVTDKRDESGRQYLVGYYTSEKELDEKALRTHLAAKLPKYMIPNYFMRLTEMPMTASGKTDRKNLPIPSFTAAQTEYAAPETELETALCDLLSELLSIEKIGVTDDFFNDLGGDSLRAIEYVAEAHNIGIDFPLQSIFDYPTVKELCGYIKNGAEKKAVYRSEDFEKYADILNRNVIDESFVPVRKSLGNVLLTGATGFLGAHILDSLMKNESGKIYCLIRSNAQDDRRGRLREILEYYFGDTYNSEIGNRIIPVVGDIEQTDLSDEIPLDIQSIIHTAATVKHYGSYEYFHNVNVLGTQNVVNFAKSCQAKLIHISTVSVSGNSLADEFEVYRSAEERYFDETLLYIGQPLENVYVRSKFEAELTVFNAMLDGLDAKIIRVGNLTNRQSDYKFQPNYQSNAFLTRVKAGIELGLLPDYLIPLYSEFSPIDATADGVVKIAQYADKQNVFHLNSNKPIYFDKLLEILHKLKIKMEVVSGNEFNSTLQRLAKTNDTEYIYEAFQNDMDENGQLIYDSNIHIVNDFTVWFMKKVGFEWKQTDFDYIKGYIDYFRNLGYLEV